MSDCCLDQWRQTIEALGTSCGCAGESAATTYTLHRRTLKDEAVLSRDDLGLQHRPTKQDFEPILVDEPCLFSGTNKKSERWSVTPEGQHQDEVCILYTVFPDIREGDNLVLKFDGKTYLVMASTYVGPLRHCFITTAGAQL